MSAERKQRLDAIGFVWDPLESAWEEGFAALTTFKSREGQCVVPQRHIEGTVKLGKWVGVQRSDKDIMSAERRHRLDAIGFVWEPLESAWEEGFAALTTFKAREGHCRVRRGHGEGTFKLAQWVVKQRQGRDTMPAERRQRLDAVGFVWDLQESAWEKGFAALTKFIARQGHCRVPQDHVEGTFKLGTWVSNRRAKKDNISAERRQQLDDIGFVWDTLDNLWEEGFAALTTFKTREGHCRVPQRHIEGTVKLGQWVGVQHTNRDIMSAERKKRLDAVSFVWSPNENAWEEGFAALNKFKSRESHCRVPDKHIEGMFKLGTWVSNRRAKKDNISAERRQRLDAIEFVWDARESAWEEGFAALEKFIAHKGHCRVPQGHVEGAFKLGTWIGHQRPRRDTMSAERKQRLNAIGFVWEPLESAWEEGFTVLTTFKAREGHCRAPNGHVEGTFKLGGWIGNQRTDKDKMPAERRHRLDAIGFVWDARKTAWEEGFAALTTFKAREGHCRAPDGHVEGMFKLGQWVRDQRSNKDKMPVERRQRLDAMGLVWNPFESAWNEGFAALTTFRAREGHCRVPWGHIEGTFKLGTWVRVQRRNRDTVSAERRERLDEIGFGWRPK